MAQRYEIRFSGSGGQGMITAAVIFAEALAGDKSRHVCQTQSYGPEARGGKSRAEVVISSTAIDYPKTIRLDILLAMNQASCDAYFFKLKPDGFLVVDSDIVEQLPTSRVISIPFTHIARDEIGREIVTNMVALGAIGRLSGQVNMDRLAEALLARVPKHTHEMNLKALQRGAEAVDAIDLTALPRSIFHDEEEV